MRIVFMGTPEFAVNVLDQILRAGHEVACVVTTPDKPAGRGQRVKASDVKVYATEHGLPVLQPEKLKDETFLEALRGYAADAFVVVAFRMLPKAVYAMPPKGTFNVHASLLPQYRGAAPIQWAIINGETKTGVTTFFLDEHTDTGRIIRQQEVEITPTDNGGSLHDKLMVAGAEIACKTLADMENGSVETFPQPEVPILKPAPKIFKEDMLIHWDNNAENIHNKIRGLSPYPAAFTRLVCQPQSTDEPGRTLNLKIYSCSISEQKSQEKPGKITIENDKKMRISTKNFEIYLENLQLEGKKRMGIEDFLKGFRKEYYTDYLK